MAIRGGEGRTYIAILIMKVIVATGGDLWRAVIDPS